MAKLITKFKFLKPNARQSVGGYAKYIATREGVDKIDESYKQVPVTVKQQQLIKKILQDFPDSKNSLEYEDYQQNKTVGTASEFITRTIEENAMQMSNSKTYADYIATRPRAQRFGAHGLFTDDGVQVNLKKVSEELNQHEDNVWTVIISLRREDAERLGFNVGERWRDMLRSQKESLSTSLNIPMQNLKWFAAFHNESHHPHVHLIAYSSKPNEGYLSPKGVTKLRSEFAKDIFAQDLLCVYEKQTEHRDALKTNSHDVITEIVSKINSGVYDNPRLEEMFWHLAERLSKTSGKKQYGYLKADVKAIVDSIVDELASNENISKLYDLWYEQREEVIKTYTDELPERIPLSQNKEFKSIRNAVIQEAMNIITDRNTIDESEVLVESEPQNAEIIVDDDNTEPTEMDAVYPLRNRKRNGSWWTDEYLQARIYLYGKKYMPPDFNKAFTLMSIEAEKGNGFAMHDLGVMYLSELGCDKDEALAQEWFQKAYSSFISAEATARNKDYFQYRIGKLYSFGYGVEQNYSKAAEWYGKAVSVRNPFAAYSLGGLYRRGQGVEQDDEQAFSLYMMAADHEQKPNAYAAYELGRMYKDGIGINANESSSDFWYEKAYKGFLAIEENMADDKLYYKLGQMNLTGTGTALNLKLAQHYFEESVMLDNTDALYGLGKLHLIRNSEFYNPPKAVEFLIDAAKKDHESAQYTLGKLFLKGEDVPKNVDYALRWLNEAVKKGNQYAEYLLGKTLLKGEETEQDLLRAKALLERSAEQGNIYAAYTLGKALLDGTLLTQNISEAIQLLAMASDKDFSPAEYVLGKLLYSGEFVPRDIERALIYLERAAENKNSFATYLAGKIRLTEESVKDISKAIQYFMTAAENGNDYAEYQLGKLYLYGKEVEQNYEKALAYLTSAASHGNQYAEQLLHSIQNNRNWSVAIGSLRLLQHLSRMLQRRIEDEEKGKSGMIDRKLRRKIAEKKELHGQKMG